MELLVNVFGWLLTLSMSVNVLVVHAWIKDLKKSRELLGRALTEIHRLNAIVTEREDDEQTD